MYLHLGQDVSVRYEDIIGVFDLDTSTVSKSTRDFLSEAEKRGQVVYVTSELPKSFIICDRKRNKKGIYIYISQISTAALRGRVINNLDI